MKRYLLPLLVFLVLLGFLAVGLRLNPREVPSPLVNRPVPEFRLPTLADPAQQLSPQDLRGTVWMLNVWASWCVACRVEHPVLVEFAKTGQVPLYGLNYKDKRPDAPGLAREIWQSVPAVHV
jgi:cytochrome c biogenesis protein CcmG/thiol:disulfide interchange protein DsbE